MPAQDLEEPFDLCDEEGRPLGRTKPRGLVHRDGDWHRSLHLWVVLQERGGADVVFQRRSLDKDTWPGRLDVAVTGHLRAGESVADALREADEEIGLRVAPERVVEIGLRRRREAHDGVRDNELQSILVYVTNVPFSSLRPNRDEVSELVRLPLAEAEALFAGAVPAVGAVRIEDFIPDADGYHARAIASVAALARGEPVSRWTLG